MKAIPITVIKTQNNTQNTQNKVIIIYNKYYSYSCFSMQTYIFKNSMSLWKTQSKLICNI